MADDKVQAKAVGGGVLVLASGALLAFLSLWESSGDRVLRVYADRLAGGLPTVCDGLTRHVTRTPIVVGDAWTDEKCDREQTAAIVRVQTQLLRCFDSEPPQPVFDAASSHAWNFGVSATCGSAAMRAWNAGQWALGCRRLELGDDGRRVWSYVKTGRTLPNGKPEMKFVQGLANRRGGERRMCMQGVVP